MHDEWVPESLLLKIAKRKCINFKRRFEEPCDLVDKAWTVPERFVARRCAPAGPGWEVLVKWTNQGYDSCTWEVRSLAVPSPVRQHVQTQGKECLEKRTSGALASALATRLWLCRRIGSCRVSAHAVWCSARAERLSGRAE